MLSAYGFGAMRFPTFREFTSRCPLEDGMNRVPKIDRARRNALKAGGLVLGALLTVGGLRRPASAAPGGNGNGNGNAYGYGYGNGNSGNNGNGNSGNCFVRGTQILTSEGYRPIETLAAGDQVAVRFAGFAPIKSVVSHTVNRVSGKWDGNPHNLPVLVKRGALGENLPAADLCLTALHAVYLDGFLVNVGDLVNGTSIVFAQASGQDTLEFFNVDLDRHDILDVQGAPCESRYTAGTERCAPLLGFDGGRSRLRSRLRSAASVVIDRRQPLDIIRDGLEERGLGFARAA
jgi:hypothetical protein